MSYQFEFQCSKLYFPHSTLNEKIFWLRIRAWLAVVLDLQAFVQQLFKVMTALHEEILTHAQSYSCCGAPGVMWLMFSSLPALMTTGWLQFVLFHFSPHLCCDASCDGRAAGGQNMPHPWSYASQDIKIMSITDIMYDIYCR